MTDLVPWESILPNWFCYRKAYEAAIARAPKRGVLFVEVGSHHGRSAAFMADHIKASGKSIRFHAVDNWADPETEAAFTRNLAGRTVTPIKSDSAEAAARYRDGSIDFVWLDAGHEYEAVRRDLDAWLPKVKRGGVIGGDDVYWGNHGVLRAVREAFGNKAVLTAGTDGWHYWEVFL